MVETAVCQTGWGKRGAWPRDADGRERSADPQSGQGEICFQIQVTNLTLPPTGSHIHAGGRCSWSVIVDLAASYDANGYASGCVTGLEKATIKAILSILRIIM